jgi:hypothetical protein
MRAKNYWRGIRCSECEPARSLFQQLELEKAPRDFNSLAVCCKKRRAVGTRFEMGVESFQDLRVEAPPR